MMIHQSTYPCIVCIFMQTDKNFVKASFVCYFNQPYVSILLILS